METLFWIVGGLVALWMLLAFVSTVVAMLVARAICKEVEDD